MERDFAFYSRWYARLRQASETLTPSLETVYYNAQQNFTLQYVVLLAPLVVAEPEELSVRKIRIAATFIDILIHRRIWNFRAIDYSTLQYAMFLVSRDIRGKEPNEVASLLEARLDEEQETFSTTEEFRLHGMNRRQIQRLLARMTDYVETRSGQASRFSEYVATGRNAYEVEHIWADHADEHTDEFKHASEFEEYRNRLGGLLLLPKSFNASYGDLPYIEKRNHYVGQNALAKSLHEKAYEHNPGFVRFVQETNLPFRPHPNFYKADLDARQELYRELAQIIWDPVRLRDEANA